MSQLKENLALNWDEVFDESSELEVSDKVSAADGLILSLNNYGRVNIQYICDVTKMDFDSVISELKGSVYQNPERWNEDRYQGWETADEYLSGNLYQKYKVAKLANEVYNDMFSENIVAIKKVIPKLINSEDIYVALGTPWLPIEFVEKFICILLDCRRKGFLVHDEKIGSWEIKGKSGRVGFYCDYSKNNLTYGTKKIDAVHIIEKLLNNQPVIIYQNSYVYSQVARDKKKVVDQKETLLANEKANLIKEEFHKFCYENEDRKKFIEKVYRTNVGCIRRRVFDGSFLTIPGMNKDITLYPYQKNAIARILFSPNTLLAHDVGAGKTYIMVAAGQELKRMGISKKNLYVVPNNIVKQWENQYKELYPNAKLKVIAPKDFTPEKRYDVLLDIKENEYDAIIMAYSSFDMIPISKAYQFIRLKEQIIEIENRIASQGTARVTNSLNSKLKRLNKELEELQKKEVTEKQIYFDQLKINTMFVDEAHNYKNVPFDTKITGMLGVNSEGSEKCRMFLEKVKCVQSQNQGRGVVFATGTPITNSISDIYVMQLYLQSTMLTQLNLIAFDSWVSNFAETSSTFEVDVDTNNYRIANRFSSFHNLTELTTMLSLFADFYQNSLRENLPRFEGYTDTLIPKSPDLKDYLECISQRADDVRRNRVKRTEDNMLKITTDGRKAALDVRLVNENAQFSTNSKVYACAENIYARYIDSEEVKGTQLVFCDTSTPKGGLNMYDELKRILIDMGMNEKEIAFIHDASGDRAKNKMLEDTRLSKIRVLVGSTWKLGMGVNVQDHLIAIHHLDVPWRPADMVQREGRIVRQGNLNKQVYIYRYITEGSFDAYSWQLLETKQRFINEILSGSLVQRNGDDIGDTVLKYAEVKALAIGNPLIKLRVETVNQLCRLVMLKKKFDEERQLMLEQQETLPTLIDKKKKQLENAQMDYIYIQNTNFEYDDEYIKDFGRSLVFALKDNEFTDKQREFADYKGFKIILPQSMFKEKPYVILKRDGEYKVEMSYSDFGVLTRLDNFFKSFSKLIDDYKDALQRLEDNLRGINSELTKTNDYLDQIKEVQKKIDEIDKELGVKE